MNQFSQVGQYRPGKIGRLSNVGIHTRIFRSHHGKRPPFLELVVRPSGGAIFYFLFFIFYFSFAIEENQSMANVK
jgi:hypothetical protein